MKRYVAFLAFFLVIMALIPAAAFLNEQQIDFANLFAQTSLPVATDDSQPNFGDKQILYLATAAQCDINWNDETIKALAVIIQTNMKQGATIDTSDKTMYLSEQQLKDKWGDAYNTNFKRVIKAVDAVGNKVLTYDGKPRYIPYFQISAGYTTPSEEYTYLTGVASPWDKLMHNYDKSAENCSGVSLYGVDYLTAQGETYKTALLWYLPKFELS